MENLMTQIFNESWLIYLLFFMIIWLTIWKWIPFLAKMFLDMRKEFTDALKEQQKTFEKTLDKISTDFVAQIRNSEEWHQKHDKKLDEIINKIK